MTSTLAWFQFNVEAISRKAQTFSGVVRPFPEERHLIAKGAFKKTISEAGRTIPLQDGDSCRIGEVTVSRYDAEGLRVHGRFYAGLDREFLKAFAAAGRLALDFDIMHSAEGVVTELRLNAAMICKNIPGLK